MKPGYKTTEFWLSTATTILGLLLASGVIPTQSVWAQVVATAAMVLSPTAYTAGRAKAKAASEIGAPKAGVS